MRLQLKQRVTDTQLILDLHFCVNEEREKCKHFKTRILKHKAALIELQYHFFSCFLSKQNVCLHVVVRACMFFVPIVFHGEFEFVCTLYF